MKGKTCCVTGHRDLPQNEINKIKAALEHEIDAAVTDGFTCFMSGFADGVDQYFAELVLERKQTNPALELIAVIPYRKRLDSLNALQCTYQQCVLPGCRAAIFLAGRHAPCQRTGGGAVGRPDCKLQCYGVRYRRKAVPYFCDFAPAALGRAFLP